MSTQYDGGLLPVNGSRQINNDVLSHNMITITARRWGAGSSVTIPRRDIVEGVWDNGLILYNNASSWWRITISSSGVITVVSRSTEAPDVGIYICGYL